MCEGFHKIRNMRYYKYFKLYVTEGRGTCITHGILIACAMERHDYDVSLFRLAVCLESWDTAIKYTHLIIYSSSITMQTVTWMVGGGG